jgi:hypothetical protein
MELTLLTRLILSIYCVGHVPTDRPWQAPVAILTGCSKELSSFSPADPLEFATYETQRLNIIATASKRLDIRDRVNCKGDFN